MFTERRDYLMDMIENLMRRVAQMLQRAKGNAVEVDALERECEQAMEDEFAELHRRMKGLEPRMVAHLIQPAARLRSYALLCTARVLLQAQRETEEAAELEPAARHALQLVLEATLASNPTESDREAVRLLFGRVDDDQLSPRYLQAIVELVTPPEAAAHLDE